MRTFAEPSSGEWTVLEVVPRYAERRRNDRRAQEAAHRGAERRRAERRRHHEVRGQVSEGLERGWLIFESIEEKRRLAPVPPGWQQLPEDALRALWRLATPVRRWRGRLIE